MPKRALVEHRPWLLAAIAAATIYFVVRDWPIGEPWLILRKGAGVGFGAVLFVISDWLIFARMGPLGESALPGLLIWPAYFAGQFLIATGVIQTLRRRV